MSANQDYSKSNKDQLEDLPIPEFDNSVELHNYNRAVNNHYYNTRLARAYKSMLKDGKTLEQVISEQNLKITKQALNDFIKKFGGDRK